MSFEVIVLGNNEAAKKELEAEITSLIKQFLEKITFPTTEYTPNTATESPYPEDFYVSNFDPSEDFGFSDVNGDQVIVQRFEQYLVLDGRDTGLELWVDTEIEPSAIELFREDFPEESYRLVTVTDAHPYDEDDAVDDVPVDFEASEPAFLTPEDEIDNLKERIVELEALLTNAGVAH